jgi:hypothetical protein
VSARAISGLMRRERLVTSEIRIPARTDLAARVAQAREAARRGHDASGEPATSVERLEVARVLRTATNCAGPPVPVTSRVTALPLRYHARKRVLVLLVWWAPCRGPSA